jgi:poly-gamma-glutamate synthesis protein (capsule biosynthesis protein)
MALPERKSISLLGDLLMRRCLNPDSYEVASLLSESDLVLGNFETSLATKGYPAPKVTNLSAPHEILKDLKRMNLKAVSLANNHTTDFGLEGLFETMEVMDQHGISHAGAGMTLKEALKPVIIVFGGIKVAFFSCGATIINLACAREDRPGLAPLRVNTTIDLDSRVHQEYVTLYPNIITRVDENDLNNVLNSVEQTRKDVDIIIMSIHWGLSGQPMVLEYEIQTAHTMLDHGVDIIMGHSPHVLHGIEMYKGKPIFYSLGHFVMHMYDLSRPYVPIPQPLRRNEMDFGFRWHSNETAIGKVVLEDSKIRRMEMTPIKLDKTGNPRLCDDESANMILEYLRVVSRFLGSSVKIEGKKAIIDS